MADSTRQQIIEAVKTRMQTITTANGYKTNAGAKVFDWLDRDLADSELDAIIIKDPSNNPVMVTLGKINNEVTVEFEVKTKAASNTAEQVREIIEDIYKAIGTDEKWSGLASMTRPGSEEIDIRQADEIIGYAKIVIRITYVTNKWSY